MARKPKIQRTMRVQSVKALIVNVKARTAPEEKTFEVSAKLTRDAQITAEINTLLSADEKVVTILEKVTKKKLYSMDETTFLKYATFERLLDENEDMPEEQESDEE